MDDTDSGDRGADYDVGYGKPPKHTQFRKGQSGNPKGRKKGSRGLKTDLDAALSQKLTITVAGRKRKGTTQELAMYALAVKAATGDMRAAKALADLVLKVFGPGDRGGNEARLSNHDQILLERMPSRLDDGAEDEERTEDAGPDAEPHDGEADDDHTRPS